MSDKVNQEDLKAKFEKDFEKLKNSIKKPNILVLGQTGVGKSSLLNTVFGAETAKVSNVKPETRGFHKFTSEESPINIIDSEGYELANSDTFKDSLNEYVSEKIANVEEQIHLAWYCINVTGARVLPFDLENIKFLSQEKKIPTSVVFTQCDLDDVDGTTAKLMSEIINNHFGKTIQCFQVSNELEYPLDIDKLVDWSINNISDENVKLAFVIGQKVNLKLNRKRAQNAIIGYATTAAAIGANPIPLSDAPLLIAMQSGMAAHIFHIYGLSFGMTDILKNIIGSRLISTVAKMGASNLLKLIPGFGTIAGGVVNAAVASVVTTTLGYALIAMSEKIIKAQIDGTFSEEFLNKILTPEFLEEAIKKHENSKK